MQPVPGAMQESKTSTPIFVVGYMHSGTTLLFNILSRDPRIFSGSFETKFFQYLPIFRQAFGDLTDGELLRDYVRFLMHVVRYTFPFKDINGVAFETIHDQELTARIVERAENERDHRRIFVIAFEELMRAGGKIRWMEKTPAHVFHIDEILKTVPDAHIVGIFRDPRDILSSKKRRKQSTWRRAVKHFSEAKDLEHRAKVYHPLWDSLAWKSAVRATLDAARHHPNNVHWVRYEDLVVHPAQEVHRLCQFLEMEFSEELLEPAPGDAQQLDHYAQGGIITGLAGRWKDVLTPTEVALCQRLVGREMVELGYALAPVRALDGLKIPLLMASGLPEFWLRTLRRGKRAEEELNTSLRQIGLRPRILKKARSSPLTNVFANHWTRLYRLVHK